jgi:hypothetical protein
MDRAEFGEPAPLFEREDEIAPSTNRLDQTTPLY